MALVVVLGQRLDLEDWASREFPSEGRLVASAQANLIDVIVEVVKDWLEPDPEPEPTPPPEDDGDW